MSGQVIVHCQRHDARADGGVLGAKEPFRRRHRLMRMQGSNVRGRRGLGLVSLGLVMAGLVVGCGASPEGGGEASCAAVLKLHGNTYLGRGGVDRIPVTTGRTLPGVLPECDDSGGQDEPIGDEPVEVEVLADVDPTVAVLFHDTIYIRDGEELPQSTQFWFRPPRCATRGDFKLTADWLGVRSTKAVRFDGDIRLPYRLMVLVTDGPSRYVATKVTLHASTSTGPELTPNDVKRSLWQGGQVVANVRCHQGEFELLTAQALPPT